MIDIWLFLLKFLPIISMIWLWFKENQSIPTSHIALNYVIVLNIETVSIENTPGLDEILWFKNVSKKIKPVKAPWDTLTTSLENASYIGCVNKISKYWVSHNYLDWAKYQNKHSSKSIWVMKLIFCQHDCPIWEIYRKEMS